MKIIIEGLSGLEDEVSSIINKTIMEIYQDTACNIESITVTNRFRDVVNCMHRRNHPNQEYISEGNVMTLSKIFKSKPNMCEIVLNATKFIANKNEFLSNLYHEVTHAKYYSDISKFRYSEISDDNEIEYVDDAIDIYTFKIIDEFNAYKQMFAKYPDTKKKYESSIRNIEIIFNLLESNPPRFADCIDYMNNITSSIGMSFPILFLNNSNYLNNKANYYGDSDVRWRCFNELYEIIVNLRDGIATDNDYEGIREYVSFILNWFEA